MTKTTVPSYLYREDLDMLLSEDVDVLKVLDRSVKSLNDVVKKHVIAVLERLLYSHGDVEFLQGIFINNLKNEVAPFRVKLSDNIELCITYNSHYISCFKVTVTVGQGNIYHKIYTRTGLAGAGKAISSNSYTKDDIILSQLLAKFIVTIPQILKSELDSLGSDGNIAIE